MKLELNRLEFLKAWQMAERSSSAKSALAAAGGILVTAGEETVLEATDFKTAIRCTAPGAQTITPGSAVLPVRLLGDFLKRIPTETATLEVTGGRGVLSAGRNRTRFTTPPVEEFPNIPRSEGAEALCGVLIPDLSRVIAEGSIASSTPADFPKYMGTCLFKVSGGALKMVSTDSKRLSLSQCPCTAEADEELLLPIPALRELSRLLSNSDQEAQARVLHDGATVWFLLPGVEFSIRRVESSFPNYEKILTSDVMTSLRIRKDELLPALERVDIIASQNALSRLVVMRLSPGGELRMAARAPDLGAALEVLDASIEGSPLQVGFNVGYFQDGLRALDAGEVLIQFNGEEGQTRMVQEGMDNFLYMLMPARLSPQDLIEDGDSEGPDSFDPVPGPEPLGGTGPEGDVPSSPAPDPEDAPF